MDERAARRIPEEEEEVEDQPEKMRKWRVRRRRSSGLQTSEARKSGYINITIGSFKKKKLM